MTNIYWPVFQNLETEVVRLTYDIHVDDNQLKVYSSKIADLILRTAIEIESITKELYFQEKGPKRQIKFDIDGLKFLNQNWILEKKIVVISSPNCFQRNRSILPFTKNDTKENGRMTYSWNNAYQKLKHNRGKNLRYGNIKNLLDIMAALFILNMYFKDEKIDLDDGKLISNFPFNMGSSLFSIKLHKWSSYDRDFKYGRREEFDECVYLTKWTDETLKDHQEGNRLMMEKQKELLIKHPKFPEYLKNNDPKLYEGDNLIRDVLGKEEYRRIQSISLKEHINATKTTKIEAIVNKNCI